ncbi:MAG: riboflavin synthase [Candidatus Eisenbacteria bacterium]|nr:riboflavin synthase [Candidatus Latescibacterota bacterium]MBD3302299.1 riboflavin synthase [Candidatus Eisenbacteria bacterium]
MFTGLVEGIGEIVTVRNEGGVRMLAIRSPWTDPDLAAGDSLAVQGVCLTLSGPPTSDGLLPLQAIAETLRRSNLGRLRVGDSVHLERAARLGDRLGGHLVQGHVDGLGRIRRNEKRRGETLLEIGLDREWIRYLVEKGSVAVDGVSLTVGEVGRDWFRVYIIPATAKATLLAGYRPGRTVNVEVDLFAKYVESLLGGRRQEPPMR